MNDEFCLYTKNKKSAITIFTRHKLNYSEHIALDVENISWKRLKINMERTHWYNSKERREKFKYFEIHQQENMGDGFEYKHMFYW